MKILCAFDSFKGCLSSAEAGEAAHRGLLSSIPDAEVACYVCADGGEGMSEAVHAAGIGERVGAVVADPLMRPVEGLYTLDREARRAYIDLAEASGLTRLSDAEKTPMKSTTFGTGQLILDALSRCAEEIFLGLGGSATNDCGLGAIQAMGAKFFEKDSDSPIDTPITGGTMRRIDRIDLSGLPEGVTIRLLCDVADDWYDCLRYAPQKGATANDLSTLLASLRHLERVLDRDGVASCRGASTGAAGASGGGFRSLLGAEICSGARVILDINGFAAAAADRPDLILTGEGCSDAQTLMGKLPAEVLATAPEGVPVALLSGRVENRPDLERAGFAHVLCINDSPADPTANPLTPAVAASRLSATASRLPKIISRFHSIRRK